LSTNTYQIFDSVSFNQHQVRFSGFTNPSAFCLLPSAFCLLPSSLASYIKPSARLYSQCG
jgi:hypothetical protein